MPEPAAQSTALLVANLAEAGLAGPGADALARLWRGLFGRGARVLDDGAAPFAWPPGAPAPEAAVWPWLRDGRVHAWRNTEAAAARASAVGRALAGAPPATLPPLADRAFALAACERAGLVPRVLRGLASVVEAAELHPPDAAVHGLQARVDAWPAWARGHFALHPRRGGGARRVVIEGGRADTPELRAALPGLAAGGGAILEPWLRRRTDYSVALHVAQGGLVTVLGVLARGVGSGGALRGYRGSVDSKIRIASGRELDAPLLEAAAELAHQAHAAGYWGPCGVDAFEFEGPEGPALRPAIGFHPGFTPGTVTAGLLRLTRALWKKQFRPGAAERLHFGLELAAGSQAPSGPALLRVELRAAGEDLGPALCVAREPEAVERGLAA